MFHLKSFQIKSSIYSMNVGTVHKMLLFIFALYYYYNIIIIIANVWHATHPCKYWRIALYDDFLLYWLLLRDRRTSHLQRIDTSFISPLSLILRAFDTPKTKQKNSKWAQPVSGGHIAALLNFHFMVIICYIIESPTYVLVYTKTNV